MRDSLVKALLHEKKMSRSSQAKVAKTLGVDRTVIHRQFTGAADISVKRVGEIASVLGRKVEFRISDNHLDEPGRNLRAPQVQGGSALLNPSLPLTGSKGIKTINSGGTLNLGASI